MFSDAALLVPPLEPLINPIPRSQSIYLICRSRMETCKRTIGLNRNYFLCRALMLPQNSLSGWCFDLHIGAVATAGNLVSDPGATHCPSRPERKPDKVALDCALSFGSPLARVRLTVDRPRASLLRRDRAADLACAASR